MIGIIGAMEKEMIDLIKMLKKHQVEHFGHLEFHKGIINNKEVVILISGIGKVNAGLSVEALILKYDIELIINFGICGSGDSTIKVGDLILVDRTVQFDVDLTAAGAPLGGIPLLKKVYLYPFDEDLEFVKQLSKKHNYNLVAKTLGTSDKFITDSSEMLRLIFEFEISIVDMEGAAIAQVAELNNKRWISIKTISDQVGEDDFETYRENSFKVVKGITEFIYQLIGGL